MSSEEHRVVCHLGEILEARGMTLTELAGRAGITMANLSILKTNKARAIRFTTLTTLCDILDCTPGELFGIAPPSSTGGDPGSSPG